MNYSPEMSLRKLKGSAFDVCTYRELSCRFFSLSNQLKALEIVGCPHSFFFLLCLYVSSKHLSNDQLHLKLSEDLFNLIGRNFEQLRLLFHRQVSTIDDLSILNIEVRLEDSKALSTVFAAERIKIRTDFKR